MRELQNVVYRTLLLVKKAVIEADDLPLDLAAGRKESRRRLQDIEKEHIISVLESVGGQKGKAAEILGIDPKTLFRKLSSYGDRKSNPSEFMN